MYGRLRLRPLHGSMEQRFTQFENDGNGNYTTLKQKNIDTGMGLERLAVVVQDVDSIFDVDTICALRNLVCEIAHKEYDKNYADDVSIRLITDHIRSGNIYDLRWNHANQ